MINAAVFWGYTSREEKKLIWLRSGISFSSARCWRLASPFSSPCTCPAGAIEPSDLASKKEDAMTNQALLELFSDLRVADVRDGMDWNLLHARGSMSPEVRPLWRTRAVGIARTARYLPYTGSIPKL